MRSSKTQKLVVKYVWNILVKVVAYLLLYDCCRQWLVGEGVTDIAVVIFLDRCLYNVRRAR